MFQVELEDGTCLDAYKHRWTRCYFHLSQGGRAYSYVWRDDDHRDASYREIEPDAAIQAVFADWECCSPTVTERTALRVALRKARAK